MKDLANKNAWASTARKRTGYVRTIENTFQSIATTCLFLLLGTYSLLAQPSQVYWTNLGDYNIGYQFSSDASTFSANEQVSVRLYLEASNPSTCIGGHFTFTVSDQVTPLFGAAITVPLQSDLGIQSAMQTEYVWDASSSETYARVFRDDETLHTCSDWILTADFLIGGTPLPASDFMASFLGGIILEENVDMRLKDPNLIEEDFVEVQVYPNPFTDWLEVKQTGRKTLEVSLWNTNGKKVFQSEVGKKSRLMLDDLPQGVFFLRVTDEEGLVLHNDKIIHR